MSSSRIVFKSKYTKCLITSMLILILNFQNMVFAEELPRLYDVYIKSTIQYADNTGMFEYKYTITNPLKNTGEISSIAIDIKAENARVDLMSDGLILLEGFNWKGEPMMRSYSAHVGMKDTAVPIVPIGGGATSSWLFGIGIDGMARWGSIQKDFRVSPGGVIDGFYIDSYGIPALRDIIVEPSWVLTVEGTVGPEDLDRSDKIKDEIAYHGRTIGPTAPPLELVPTAFMDNLISMTTEAEKLGWITNPGIARSLQAKLDAARKKYASGNNAAAANILRALINEADAQACASHDECKQGQHLTPEAHALIKYNAQYLIDHMK